MRQLANTQPKNPSETISERGSILGMMGLPSSGKTSLLTTLLPDYGPIAHFNVDGGASVLPDMPEQIQVYTPRDYAHLEQMTDEICANPVPFKTIVTDVVTMVQDENVEKYGIHDIPASNARGRQVGYGDSNWDVLQYHRKMMRCAEQHDVNIIFIYWASRPAVVEGSGSTLTTRHIVLSPTVSLKVTGILDVLVYIEKQTGLNPYPPMMVIDGNQSIETRRRLNPNNPFKKWPNTVANPSLSKVISAIRGEIFDDYSYHATANI